MHRILDEDSDKEKNTEASEPQMKRMMIQLLERVESASRYTQRRPHRSR